MTDFDAAREKMVDCQIRTFDVTDPIVLGAIGQVQREAFVPKALRELSYSDQPLEIAEGRYLSAPAPFARMAQVANVQEDEVVLVVGSGTGYAAAVFSLLASSVIGLESVADLASNGQQSLTDLKFDNAVIVEGDLAKGYPKEAPYDLIFIDGAVETVPELLFDQLADGGRLVAAEGKAGIVEVVLYEKANGIVGRRAIQSCTTRPLPGFEVEKSFQF